ncbi:MAG: hypothetical protein A3H79_04690 [Candidatus Levybacteria bacterium RIFCSPLOWO2_02_FULL_36_8b]|nr:MAG: hypothetical protein A3H79_04690 [Candidatus Levybacteria bacterium RIFCSPLOWO2_02_FULL_36_8b]
MSNNILLLKQIGDLIDEKLDTKLDAKLKPFKNQLNGTKSQLDKLKKQLDNVELKVEVVNKRVEQAEKNTKKAIEKSQEDTIEALSSLMHSGYDGHERRIKRIEKHLDLPQLQE